MNLRGYGGSGAYHAAAEEAEEDAGGGGGQQLGGDVQHRPELRDVAAHHEPHRHRGVQVAAGDVEPGRHQDASGQRVRDSHRRQRRHRHSVAGLPVGSGGHGGGDAGEDEEEGEDELGQHGAHAADVQYLVVLERIDQLVHELRHG